MTLSNTKRVITHVGNGVATGFAYDFLIPTADDIVVRVLDTTTGVVTTIDPADFSVSGLGEDAGGEVTYPLAGAPLAATDEISILREVAYTQDTDIVNQGGFFPDVLMEQLDRIVMQTQQLAEQMDRTVKLSEFDEVGDLDALTSAVQSLALIETEILAVEAIITEITAVEGNSANINIVAGLEAAINTLAAIDTEISTLAGLDTELAALYAIRADIETVADNIVDVTNFADVYLGPAAADPATRTDGSALQAGDLYFNTTAGNMRVYDGAVWELIDTLDLASQAEAEAGVANDKLVTPLRVAQQTTARLASQAEAEAGTNTTKLLTPERARQLLEALGLRSGTSQAASGTANIFTDIPSWVKRITIQFDDISSDGGDHFLVRLGDIDGLESSGYSSSSLVPLAGGSSAGTSTTNGFVVYGGSAGVALSGIFVLERRDGNAWVASHSMFRNTTSVSSGGGKKTLSGTLDRVQILTAAGGSFDSGNFNIKYE